MEGGLGVGGGAVLLPSTSALGAISGGRCASLTTLAPAVAALSLPVTSGLALGEPACCPCHSSLRQWWQPAVADLWAASLSRLTVPWLTS